MSFYLKSGLKTLALGRTAIKNGLPPHRLMLAPDCGLGFLPLQVGSKKRPAVRNWIVQVAEAKLANMVEAAKQLNNSSA